MPKYQIELSDGRKFEVEADAEPTEQDVLGAIGGAPMASHDAAAPAARTWTDTAVDALPTLGGAAGGIIGGIGGTVAGMGVGGVPGAVGGAALGGGFGEAAKQLVNRARGMQAPGTMGEAAKDIGIQGGIQGAAELAGAGIGKGAQYVGGRLYSLALRPAAKLTNSFGDVAAAGLEAGVPVSAGGAVKAAGLRAASSQAADQMVTNAAGAVVPTSAATRGFTDVAKDAAQRASLGMADDTADVWARASVLGQNYPGGIPVEVAQGLKKSAQKAADTAFRAQERGGLVKTVEAQLNKATATGLKAGIEGVVPGIAEQNAKTQTLIGLSKALGAANSRQNTMSKYLIPLAIGGASGHTSGIAAGAATAALMNPQVMSQAGIAADRIGGSGVSQQAIRAALLALMSNSSGDGTGR